MLLKNNGVLPLDMSKIGTLAVIGPNANSRSALIGNYHGTSSRYITVLEGIQDVVGDEVRVLYAQGSHLFRDREENLGQPDDRIAEALAAAEAADAVVLVVGLDETLEGEEGDTGNAAASGDKLDLLLPACQRKLMEAVLAVGKPTVICLMAGSSIDMQKSGEDADAVLLTWYPGARGGRTVADILFGRVSPSGKLPLTFYHNEQLALMPEFTDYSMKGRTYRYFEHEPLYPFGYGLTYGDVYCETAQIRKEGEKIFVDALMRNAGAMAVQDVVQVYIHNENSTNAPLNPRLCAFKRICVEGGASEQVTLEIPKDSLKVVNENGEYVSEGRPVLYVGTSQPDARSFALTGHACVKMDM